MSLPSSSSSSSSFQSINTTNNNTITTDYSNTHIDYIIQHSHDKLLKYNDLLRLQSMKPLLDYRQMIVMWLKKVTHVYNLCSLIRDTAFILFDTYLLNLSRDYDVNNIINNSSSQERIISLAAISCVLLSSKLHNYHSVLSLSNFNDFHNDEITEYQFEFLRIINFDIHINTTPAVCIDVLLSLWPCDDDLRDTLKHQADIFVAEFHSLPVSMMFAPSTIAICAIILSFSTSRMDCTQWLNCLPDKCFRGLSLEQENKSMLLDIDKCLDIFQRVEKVHFMLPKSSSLSPTSVVTNLESPVTSPTKPSSLPLPPSSTSSTIVNRRLDDDLDVLDALGGSLDIDAIEEDL